MERRIINAVAIYTIILIILISVTTIVVIEEVKKNNKLYDILGEALEEKCLLMDYVENIDTYSSIEEAVKAREDLMYDMQFINE